MPDARPLDGAQEVVLGAVRGRLDGALAAMSRALQRTSLFVSASVCQLLMCGGAGELQGIQSAARGAASTIDSAKAEVSQASAALSQAAAATADIGAAAAAATTAAAAAVAAQLQPKQHPLKELALQVYRVAADGIDRTIGAVQAMIQSTAVCMARRRSVMFELLQVKIQHACLQLTDLVSVRCLELVLP